MHYVEIRGYWTKALWTQTWRLRKTYKSFTTWRSSELLTLACCIRTKKWKECPTSCAKFAEFHVRTREHSTLPFLFLLPSSSVSEDEFLASPQSKLTDGIIIATSHSSHYEVAMKAMGKFHILMEKPMTTDLAEADALTKTALRCDKIFMLNNTANFRPSAEKVHDLIKSAWNCRKYCVQKATKRIAKEISRVSVGRVIDQLSTVPRWAWEDTKCEMLLGLKSNDGNIHSSRKL